MEVKVSCDAGHAIYVNDTRVTDRSTKWGIKTILCEFTCPQDQVVSRLIDRGMFDHVKHIDTEPYLSIRDNIGGQP